MRVLGGADASTGDDLDQALLRAQVKSTLFGSEPDPVQMGPFAIVRRLGRGGYGAVYEALDDAGERVALKVLHGGAGYRGERPKREFRALQRVAHPNLVALRELYCQGAQWFFSMELIDGVDLVSYARDDDTPNQQRLRGAFLQLLDGLRALHGARKLHRDLKPSNVLVDRGGRTVLLDYGLVVDQDAALDASSSGRAGTPSYMAPEQFLGAPVGPAADMYAVGRMLSEALSGAARASDELSSLCADLLQYEPARRPSAEQAWVRMQGVRLDGSLARGTSHFETLALSGASHSVAEPFVGREAQLEALRTVLARVRAGDTYVAWVHGASGMGKSALLRRFVAQARASGALILEGRCYERENTPFKAFDGIVTSLVRQLRSESAAALHELLPSPSPALLQLFPELARLPAFACAATPWTNGDARELQRAAFTALRELLTRLGERRTLALVIDDLQWGDADSARLLAQLLSAPSPPTLALIGGFRREEQETSPFLRRLFSCEDEASLSCPSVEVPVENFTPSEAEALAHALRAGSSQRTGVLGRELVQRTRGAPFLLHELLCSAESERHADLAADDLIAARADSCSRSARELLALLCLAGQPLRLSLLAAAVELETSAWSSAHELCALRLARFRETESQHYLEPYHDIVREVIARRSEPEDTRRRHHGLARTLEAQGTHQIELLLCHWLGAGERLRARPVAERAAQQAEHAFAWSRAADLYRTALTLFDDRDARRRLNQRLARVLTYAGDHNGAAEAFSAAARATPDGEDAALEQAAAVQLLLAGRSAQGAALMRTLLRRVGVRYPRTRCAAVRMFVLARLRLAAQTASPWLRAGHGRASPELESRRDTLRAACTCMFPNDPWGASALHAYALAEVRGSGSRQELHALAWEVAQLSLLRGVAGERTAHRLRAELLGLVRTHDAPYERGVVCFAEAFYLFYCRERPAEALSQLDRGDALLAQSHATHFERGSLEALRIDLLATVGEPRFRQHALSREREHLGRADGYSLQQLQQVVPTLRLMEDRPELALAFLDRHWPERGRVDDVFDFFALVRRCQALLYAGREQEAYDVLRRHWRALARHSAQPQLASEMAYLRARGAAGLYVSSRCPALRREALRYARPTRQLSPVGRGILQTVTATIALADRQEDEARSALRSALAGLEQGQQRTLAWSVRYRLAQLDGQHASLRAAQSWLHAFGVVAPEPWVSTLLPAGPVRRS